MISNLWNDIELYCGNEHEGSHPMVLHPIGKDLCYICSTRLGTDGDVINAHCKNRLSVTDFEKMIDYLGSIITDAELNGNEVNLTNFKWKKKNIEYHILEHDKKFKISVVNRSDK